MAGGQRRFDKDDDKFEEAVDVVVGFEVGIVNPRCLGQWGNGMTVGRD